MYWARHPRGSYLSIVYSLLFLEVATPDIRSSSSTLSSVGNKTCGKCRSPPDKWFFNRMQLTLHATRQIPHGTLRLVQAMSAWSLKNPTCSVRHCTDGRAYGHTTAAMHDNAYTPAPPPSLWKCLHRKLNQLVEAAIHVQVHRTSDSW